MPRGGGNSAPMELALLTRWIDQGAKFDGRNPAPVAGDHDFDIPIERGDPVKTGSRRRLAQGFDPFLPRHRPGAGRNCIECHGTQRASGGLQLSDFKALLKGGNSGLAVEPGKPAESLLIKKLKGTAGERMPLKRPPLPAESIAKIEKWIAEGVHFDGGDPAQPTDKIAAAYRFAHLGGAEKAAERAAQRGDIGIWPFPTIRAR